MPAPWMAATPSASWRKEARSRPGLEHAAGAADRAPRRRRARAGSSCRARWRRARASRWRPTGARCRRRRPVTPRTQRKNGAPATSSIVKKSLVALGDELVERDEVRVRDVGERAELALEADDGAAVDVAQGLERDHLVALAIERLVDDAHAAGAEAALHGEAAAAEVERAGRGRRGRGQEEGAPPPIISEWRARVNRGEGLHRAGPPLTAPRGRGSCRRGRRCAPCRRRARRRSG